MNEVAPETVCQFSGLYNMTGKKFTQKIYCRLEEELKQKYILIMNVFLFLKSQ